MNALSKLAKTVAVIAVLAASPALAALPQDEIDEVFTGYEIAMAEIPGGSLQGSGTYDVTFVAAGGEQEIIDGFEAGTTLIALIGDENVDLDLYVVDANDNLLCSSEGNAAREVCQIRLTEDQDLYIYVANVDETQDAEFLVWTN